MIENKISPETEYKTLRDEILQYYREQTQLIFASTLTAVGAFILKSSNGDISLPSYRDKTFVLIAAMFLISAIAWKVRANYYKIFAIGSYLAVFHERRGVQPNDYHPGPGHVGWHTRWRKIDLNPENEKFKGKLGRSTAQADMVFLTASTVALLLIYGAVDKSKLIYTCATNQLNPLICLGDFEIERVAKITLFSIAIIFLLRVLSQLWNIQKHVSHYREDFELLANEELSKNTPLPPRHS